MYVYMTVCMYLCMYVCTYVCMNMCVCVSIVLKHIYIMWKYISNDSISHNAINNVVNVFKYSKRSSIQSNDKVVILEIIIPLLLVYYYYH